MEVKLLATDRVDLLRLFVRIVETGYISEAARSLGLSQPSASRCLKQLEARVGTRLIQRSPHGLGLTHGGQAFLVFARRLLQDWDAAMEAVKVEQQALSGGIRVAAPIAIGQSLLASVVARFIRRHPGVTIEWNLTDDPVDVSPGGYDLWIRAGNLPRDDLVVREIYHTRRAIVVAPIYPVVDHPRDLQATRAVRLATFVPTSIELTHESGDIYRLKQSAVFTTDNIFAARAAVLEAAGYAILPLWIVQSDLNRGALVQTCRAWRPPDVTLSLAYAADNQRPARVKALIDHMKTELTRDDGLGIAFLNELGAQGSVASA